MVSQQVLRRLGIATAYGAHSAADDCPSEHHNERSSRCFPSMPSLSHLIEDWRLWDQARPRDASSAKSDASKHPSASGATNATTTAAAPDPGSNPDCLLAILRDSRTFQAPDGAAAMATALGVGRLYRGLHDSSAGLAEADIAVQKLRDDIKRRTDGAWSQEAVKRGVQCANRGEPVFLQFWRSCRN